MKKTKAITELENRGAEFSVHEININGFVSGSKLARDGGQNPAEVFKTARHSQGSLWRAVLKFFIKIL